MAKQGLYGGNPDLIWESNTDTVIKMYNFSNFISDYESTAIAINTEQK